MYFDTIIAGFGGQGVLFMGNLMAYAAMEAGRQVTFMPVYGVEMRGGTANCTVVVSDEEIASPVASNPDIAVVMNNPSLMKFSNLVRSGGTLLVNSSLVETKIGRADLNVVPVPVSDLAHELGEDRSANVVMMGAFVAVTGLLDLDAFKEALAETNLGKKPKVLELNRKALEVGAAAARRALGKE